MILRTKQAHRIFIKKKGIWKNYPASYVITTADEDLYEAIRYHRLYKRDLYIGKIESAAQLEEPVIEELNAQPPVAPSVIEPVIDTQVLVETPVEPTPEVAPEVIAEPVVEAPQEPVQEPVAEVKEETVAEEPVEQKNDEPVEE